ncbi:MAG TPA: hypothetical protein P5550_01635 [Bacteroidales bacterium]|nr:hypothetical protein [Bacteroidales bacterium]HRZ75949.1 hypothetical protein [Bacteroidales bacterium]
MNINGLRNLDAPGANYSPLRWCRWCGYPIGGRTDKRYCDTECKNAWHRWLREQGLHGPIRKVLMSNWRVLEIFHTSGREWSTVQELEENGFRTKFHTHRGAGENRRTYSFCFNYGWSVLSGKTRKVHIIRQDGESLN